MPVLVRRVTKGALWAAAKDPSKWAGDNFPYELLSELSEKTGPGISFWEVSSRRDPMLKRVAAALVLRTGGEARQVQSVDFRCMPASYPGTLGIAVSATDGRTSDQSINGLHREITGISGPQAVALAKRLCMSPSVAFGTSEVARFIVEGLRGGRLSETSITKDMLSSLKGYGAVKVIMPPKK